MENLIINTEYIKLGQALKLAAIAQSGAHAKILIQDGEVFVNGEEAYQRGKKLFEGDIITVGSEEFIITTVID